MLLGPRSYIQSEQFEQRLASIKRGADRVFNYGLDQHGNAVTALLVSVQTDYAAWLGTQETLSCFAAVAKEAASADRMVQS